MNGTALRASDAGVVLAGVNAKPFGWPPASLDPGCGQRRTDAPRKAEKQEIPTKSGLHGLRGLPTATARKRVMTRLGAANR